MSVTLPLFSFDCRFFLKKSKINRAGERRREGWREGGKKTYDWGFMYMCRKKKI